MRRRTYDQIITIFKIIAVCVFNAQASPRGAFKRQNGLAQARWRGLAPTSLFFVQRNTRCASDAKSSWLFCKVCRRCAKVCRLCRKNKKAMKSFDFTASTVDIPMRWNPRAKQSRTVALLAALRAAALFEPPSIVLTKRKTRTQTCSGFSWCDGRDSNPRPTDS